MRLWRCDDGAEVPAVSVVTVAATTPPKVEEDPATPAALDPLSEVDASVVPIDLARWIIGWT